MSVPDEKKDFEDWDSTADVAIIEQMTPFCRDISLKA